MTIVIESQSIAPSHRNARGDPVAQPGRKRHEWYMSVGTTTGTGVNPPPESNLGWIRLAPRTAGALESYHEQSR